MVYKKQEETPQTVSCFTGYSVKERILVYKPNETPTELGFKTFHCIRRFTVDYLAGKCNLCTKDINKESFYIHKQYYSQEMLLLMIRVYEKGVKERFSGAIWPDNQYFNDIIKCMAKPMPMNMGPKPIKKDYFQEMEEKKDRIEEVPF